MKFIIVLSFIVSNAMSFAQTPADYHIQEVPFNEVSINDQFWSPRIETNRTATIPSSFQKCEETGRVENFVLAANHTGKFLTEFPFDDTDIYKIIEGASYSMSVHPDPKLDHYVDSLINLIAKAQEPDGYLYTARTINPEHPHPWAGKERWVNESVMSHELYNSGHLFEAAAAHYLATGKRNFLNIALKNADLLCEVFSPGKRDDVPGHEIVEMGLVRLYRITGEKKYLNLAKFFIDCRGKNTDPKRAYWQDQAPVVDQTEAVGHAVRAGYLYSGVADVAALTGNQDYLHAIDNIWENMVTKKLYITGGIGARHDGEAFGDDYELPNLTAYNETCAAIANVFWNYRMFLLHGEAMYMDVLERTLYNGLISGVSLDGQKFFYPNPLESNMVFKFNQGALTRKPWFDCSCCPTNMCRFLPSVSRYIYARKNDRLYVNLFIAGKANVTLEDNKQVEIIQQTQYPWEGNVKIVMNPKKKTQFSLYLRIPGWVKNQPVPGNLYTYLTPGEEKVTLDINGKPFDFKTGDGYAIVTREWKKGDVVEYNLPMKIHRVIANSKVAADMNKATIERGPIVYCLEGIDNDSVLSNIVLPDDAILTASFMPGKLNGIEQISGEAIAFVPSSDGLSISTVKRTFTAIPYCVWDNRGADQMKVWIPRKITGLNIADAPFPQGKE